MDHTKGTENTKSNTIKFAEDLHRTYLAKYYKTRDRSIPLFEQKPAIAQRYIRQAQYKPLRPLRPLREKKSRQANTKNKKIRTTNS